MRKVGLILTAIILIPLVEFAGKTYAQENKGYIYGRKSSKPRMIEVEEEVWFKLNQDLLDVQQELIKTKTELKISQAELEKEKSSRDNKDDERLRKNATVHRVQKNESLWKIAVKYYKDPSKWRWLYKANIKQIDDPNLIYPEQILDVPQY